MEVNQIFIFKAKSVLHNSVSRMNFVNICWLTSGDYFLLFVCNLSSSFLYFDIIYILAALEVDWIMAGAMQSADR
jgi:hypothetical protein